MLPFIGRAYAAPSVRQFRVAAVGMNSYLSAKDYRGAGVDRGDWFASWWKNACRGADTHRFYEVAYREVDQLATALARSSRLFKRLRYDGSPRTKPGLYATNAVKVYTTERYKESSTLTDRFIRSFAETWAKELDVLAKYAVLPHLIVVFGRSIWDSMLAPLYVEGVRPAVSHEHLDLVQYTTCGDHRSTSYHHANRVEVRTGSRRQHVLVVRVDHPSARTHPRRDATWLLRQPDFRRLAKLTPG